MSMSILVLLTFVSGGKQPRIQAQIMSSDRGTQFIKVLLESCTLKSCEGKLNLAGIGGQIPNFFFFSLPHSKVEGSCLSVPSWQEVAQEKGI